MIDIDKTFDEMTREIDREILETLISQFKPEFGKGEYTIKQIIRLFRRKQLMNRYGEKSINYNFYGTFEIAGSNGSILTLTTEEFRAGKPGYILGNFKTDNNGNILTKSKK